MHDTCTRIEKKLLMDTIISTVLNGGGVRPYSCIYIHYTCRILCGLCCADIYHLQNCTLRYPPHNYVNHSRTFAPATFTLKSARIAAHE